MSSTSLETLPEKERAQLINNLEQLYQILYASWNRSTQGKLDIAGLQTLINETQEMANVADSHALGNVCDGAKELVLRLRWVLNKGKLDSNDQKLVVKQMDTIKSQIFSLKPDNVITLHTHAATEDSRQNAVARVGLLDNEEASALNIKFLLEEANYAVDIFNDPTPLKEAMIEHQYDIVLVDLLLPNCPLASAISVEDFLSNNPIDVPVIMLSEQADLATRLIALRAGIKAYLTKPLDENELLDKVRHILSKRSEARMRVLVVDDDPMLTEYYETALGEEGFIVKSVNDPITVLEIVDEFKPHVITLDYTMPGCNGLEVAEILRGDPRYMKIPIVFMSAAEEAMQRRGLMNIFGNAFLEKPVDIDLLTDTLNEITAKSRKVTDNFEKVSKRNSGEHLENRDYFLSSLQDSLEDRLFKENIDKNHYLILATIDNIPVIKENYGSLALMRMEDKIENYFSRHPKINGHGCTFGEHSYLLMVDDEKKEDAEVLFKHFRESFKTRDFLADAPKNYLSLSLGVVKLDGTLPTNFEEIIQLIETANISASNGGGDQIHWAATHQHSDAPSEEIFDAIKTHSYQLAFQSIVRPDGDEQIFEALVRLVDADGNIHSPERFLPYVDDALNDGSYHLDRWVIENAFRSLETTSGRGAAEFSIVIKLTPNLKQVERLLPFIFNICSNTRLRGNNRIYFSISEPALLANVQQAKSIIKAIDTAGCGFIIEHCQANDRSVNAIEKLKNIDFVKLDPSLTSGNSSITDTRKRIASVRKAMGEQGEIIAGLVEDANTFAHFWDMDIRYFQGFFIHKPNNNMNYKAFEAESLVLER
ncbi:MAG: response regulator [Agarilytica sp.]